MDIKEYNSARESTALFDLSDAGKVELAGPEARIFLHNLCTQDVKNLAEGAGGEAFLTTAKARVVAHVGVNHVRWQGQAVLWLDTTPGRAERILQHLDHFLISEQVELADRTQQLAMLRLAGPAAAGTLARALGVALPELKPWHNTVAALEGQDIVVRHQLCLNLPGYDCFCAPSLVPMLTDRLVAAGAVQCGPEAHEVLRVEAGWPIDGIDMDENRFVVEVGRAAQAICYTKGCFLGQEPIVMARDRGQVNRMFLGFLCGDAPVLAPGTKLLQGDADVGLVTSSVMSPRLGQTIALAYLRRGSQEPGTTLTVESAASGRTATVSSLPL